MNAEKVCSPALTDLEILLVCVVVITWRSYNQGERNGRAALYRETNSFRCKYVITEWQHKMLYGKKQEV